MQNIVALAIAMTMLTLVNSPATPGWVRDGFYIAAIIIVAGIIINAVYKRIRKP